MFRLGDLVINKKSYAKRLRIVVGIESNHYKLRVIEGLLDGCTLYISHGCAKYYQKVGNVFEKHEKNTCN